VTAVNLDHNIPPKLHCFFCWWQRNPFSSLRRWKCSHRAPLHKHKYKYRVGQIYFITISEDRKLILLIQQCP